MKTPAIRLAALVLLFAAFARPSPARALGSNLDTIRTIKVLDTYVYIVFQNETHMCAGAAATHFRLAADSPNYEQKMAVAMAAWLSGRKSNVDYECIDGEAEITVLRGE